MSAECRRGGTEFHLANVHNEMQSKAAKYLQNCLELLSKYIKTHSQVEKQGKKGEDKQKLTHL